MNIWEKLNSERDGFFYYTLIVGMIFCALFFILSFFVIGWSHVDNFIGKLGIIIITSAVGFGVGALIGVVIDLFTNPDYSARAAQRSREEIKKRERQLYYEHVRDDWKDFAMRNPKMGVFPEDYEEMIRRDMDQWDKEHKE